ncbi:hypothetical protein GQ43DRAFT_434454 [Delitschia confertaspora ATCC 74209]|uniref:Histone transcription regulator 3 homolog n=1 Tax=Delitschia confertaspora ATCC 74209 TaxID=1513339 RepID=A0A9P4MPG9_9PLEO|nr:hypothetical protein GQ43DRAFT_434454 [Delitschia confertaspora ATCC 74209]
MSAFKALNVESDNESEDEIDNTKEIQIEEALKLYQAALKYHSEGPRSFDKAAEAYKALFESEIFTYPEALSEYGRHELYGDSLEFDSIFQDDSETGPVQLAGGNESAPNTLPQILHLAYKNHGQFLLELTQHRIRQHGVSEQEAAPRILAALNYFAEALDKDDADLDLWSRTASVGALLRSRRITRFCLEAVLDGDDELFDSILRLPGLEEGFAAHQLKELVSKMEDDLSLAQAPLSSLKRKRLPEILKQRLNPYAFSPLPSEIGTIEPPPPSTVRAQSVLSPTTWDWAGLGEAILRFFMAVQGGFVEAPPGSGMRITMPSDVPVEEDSLQIEERPTEGNKIAQKPEGVVRSKKAPNNNCTSGDDGAPNMDGEDIVMGEGDQETALILRKENSGSATPQEPAPLQNRKRSTDSAGLPETAEGGRSRSKRIRARESIMDGVTGPDTAAQTLAKQMEDKLNPAVLADQYLFEIVNDIFSKMDVEGLGSPKVLRDMLTKLPFEAISDEGSVNNAAKDMYMAIQSGDPKIAGVLLPNETVDLGGMSRQAGLDAFLGYAKSGISQACSKPTLGSEKMVSFAQVVNSGWFSIREVAFSWAEALLVPGSLSSPGADGESKRSSYMCHRWTEDLKRNLVQIIVNFDEFIYEQLRDRVSQLNSRILEGQVKAGRCRISERDAGRIEMIETLFELHLDVYSLIKHPHSGVDPDTQTLQSDRLERWASLAREVMQLRTECNIDVDCDELALRHIWASIFHMNVIEHIRPEYLIAAMEELKTIFRKNGEPTIEMQNNAVMPELSVAAVDRELARISMKDFFLRVFDQDEKDPVTVIESLEPILESMQYVDSSGEQGDQANDDSESRRSSTVARRSSDSQPDGTSASRPSALHEMRRFLDTASVSLRLSLWQRLREAYETIEYPPKVVSCYLRSIETLVSEFKSSIGEDPPPSERHLKLMSRLRVIDEMLVKILNIMKNDKAAFDCLTYEHLQSSMSAVSRLLRIMAAGNVYEDMLRAGLVTAPRFEGCPSSTFVSITGRLHDMQLRAWILQYLLLKEGIHQNPEAYPTPSEDLFEYFRHVHYATGIRGFCHAANRTFLKLAKDEVLRMDDYVDGNTRDVELSQILYDLYGLKTFINSLECHEFGTSPEILEKKTATQLLPFILQQARKINIKDLLKSELRSTIEKVHGALGRAKLNDDISFNRKLILAYLKSPINPMALFQCYKGIGTLSTKHIPAQSAEAASIGWYFLMGNLSLNKFRSQKKTTAGPTEDIDVARAFFMQELEYTIDRWETWYRLGQAYDAHIEDAVSWTAEKLNNNNSVELINLQRSAIHCYTMAVACVERDGPVAPPMAAKVSELYTDFGNRVYASSREPFSMHGFKFRDNESKFYSSQDTHIVYQKLPWIPLSDYRAWKFASALFNKAIAGNPDKWWNWFMRAKCMWKMHRANIEALEPRLQGSVPTAEDVLDEIVHAIHALPGKKDKRDPILEPHYKLVSIVHKMVLSREMDVEMGWHWLKHTPYSENIGEPESLEVWDTHILAILKSLRNADKSGWHHRMVSRVAHVIYGDSSSDEHLARAAKLELCQQMFTKTMTIQVWKPEHERPGRHFVFTTRYTGFFVQLLVQTNDRTNLEMLAKRVRKKPHEFFEHTKLWGELCLSYLKLLRRAGKIPEGYEDTVFKALGNEEFQARANMVETWTQSPTSEHLVLDILREAIELKRLNNGLMKPLLIDDLIGDTYAMLYATVGPTLDPSQHLSQPTSVPPAVPASVTSVMQLDGPADALQRAHSPFGVFHSDQQRNVHPEPISRPRAKGVGRREIARRAEACVAKPVLPMPPSTPSMPIRSPTKTHVQVMIPRLTGFDATPSDANRLSHLQVTSHSGTMTGPSSATNVESSAPASIQDSADDESELSELDDQEVSEILGEPAEETVVMKPLFPNLSTNKIKSEDAGNLAGGSRRGSVVSTGGTSA